jgi:hypothetical protein
LRTKLLYYTTQLDIPMCRGDFVVRYSDSVIFATVLSRFCDFVRYS